MDSHIADYADILSEEVQAKPVAAFAERISEHFKSIGLSLRLLQNCSTRMLNDIRHLLSFRFDEAKQVWVELEFFPGVSMPKLPNAFHVCQEQAQLLDKYKFHYDFEAQTATVEFLTVLQGCLESTIKRRRMAGLDVDLSGGVVVNYKVDSAGVGHGRHMTPVCFTFPELAVHPNSPNETFAFCIFDGDDSNVGIRDAIGEQVMEQMRHLKSIQVEGKDVDVELRESGDLKYLVSSSGMASCSALYPCVLCLAHKSELGRFDKVWDAHQGGRLLLRL